MKKLLPSVPEGQWMKPGDTFNGGVMLVSPQREIFNLLSADCQTNSNWHSPTSYPESHYLKWVADWRSLSQSLNLCPRMGKGQANTPEWQNTPWCEVEIFHFSAQSKPYLWLHRGTIDCLWNSAEGLPEERRGEVQTRARRAYHLWVIHLAMALFLVATRQTMKSLGNISLLIATRQKIWPLQPGFPRGATGRGDASILSAPCVNSDMSFRP